MSLLNVIWICHITNSYVNIKETVYYSHTNFKDSNFVHYVPAYKADMILFKELKKSACSSDS